MDVTSHSCLGFADKDEAGSAFLTRCKCCTCHLLTKNNLKLDFHEALWRARYLNCSHKKWAARENSPETFFLVPTLRIVRFRVMETQESWTGQDVNSRMGEVLSRSAKLLISDACVSRWKQIKACAAVEGLKSQMHLLHSPCLSSELLRIRWGGRQFADGLTCGGVCSPDDRCGAAGEMYEHPREQRQRGESTDLHRPSITILISLQCGRC